MARSKLENLSRSPYDRRIQGGRNGKLRKELYKKFNGFCFYCKCKTEFTKEPQLTSDNAATIEHLYCKLDIRRSLCDKTVLACYKCNKDKAKLDNKKFQKDSCMYSELIMLSLTELITYQNTIQ